VIAMLVALAGGDLTSGEHEITLSAEVVDIDKHVVPKERVRLQTDVETREVAVDEDIRKERIEMDSDDTKPSPLRGDELPGLVHEAQQPR
jgi:stress response protein YsnF